MPGRWITQRDIAEKIGVHVTTVSLALRNHPSISAATRGKIQELARNLGYSPNPALSSLIAYRRAVKPIRSESVIGFLTPYESERAFRQCLCDVEFFSGAQKRAQELGYKLDCFWLRQPGLTARRWNTILQTRNLAGLIVGPLPTGRGHLRLDWGRFSAVKIDPNIFWPPLHCITNNQLEAMRLAMRTAFHHGYRRIGVAMRHSHNERVNRYWSASYLDEQSRQPKCIPIPMCLPRDWGEKVFLDWVSACQPDVVLSTHVKVQGWLTKAGYRVPEDIGFIDLDCFDHSGIRAGINQQHRQVGSTAVDTLISLIHNNEKGLPETPRTILLGNCWVEGKTIRVANGGMESVNGDSKPSARMKLHS
ncbi:MAG TPA: LacI family DNA-binding transcriptional regulator [Chthoniobacteraceae bacterium]|jgi:LacI family transcriptional regulator|nr:LacI family DNA-binding transcriptional regulator [Chthoniobacteraceae bacterium]